MLSVNIITVGKLKESYLREACAEYSKRLQPFCKLAVTELPEIRISDNPSEKEIFNVLASEGRAILGLITAKSAFNVAMCIEGGQLSSMDFSKKIESVAVSGKSVINLIIGSSFGISDEVKSFCDLKLSMSKMTFPHQLARVMLLEQVYRAFQILSNGKYHK
ncbi:MAG: 23S rRNA (pseudouridine(1915)-N(3))-methyltransferase RlmH [Oscillospiraceae bacterium]